MSYSDEEIQFIKFLKSFPQFYKKAHVIAENKDGISILPTGKGRNEFKMYALDDICHSCNNFYEDGIYFTPKTTDAIWYKKKDDKFFIFLIEFKGDKLCKNSSKCSLVEVFDTIKLKNDVYHNEFQSVIKSLEKIINKYSDRMLNGLAAKPLETVTIALPLIYEEYYEKNKDSDDVEHIDIRDFLDNARIVYRVVSIGDENANRQRSRGRAYRCSNMIPSSCDEYALKNHDRELNSSYESSLKTYYKRYEKAGIVNNTGFVDNTAFNNFIAKYLK